MFSLGTLETSIYTCVLAWGHNSLSIDIHGQHQKALEIFLNLFHGSNIKVKNTICFTSNIFLKNKVE